MLVHSEEACADIRETVVDSKSIKPRQTEFNSNKADCLTKEEAFLPEQQQLEELESTLVGKKMQSNIVVEKLSDKKDIAVLQPRDEGVILKICPSPETILIFQLIYFSYKRQSKT